MKASTADSWVFADETHLYIDTVYIDTVTKKNELYQNVLFPFFFALSRSIARGCGGTKASHLQQYW